MRIVQSWILNVGSPESVRKIPINKISLTGEVLGKAFESSLERDLIMTMAWSSQLDWFQVQPVQIKYQDVNGASRRYTPDLLVSFRQTDTGGRKPLLCEVKYRDDLKRNWAVLRPKFKAAFAYAKEKDWDFRIFTEDRIRTPLLKNIQFLWSYRFSPWHTAQYQHLLEMLDDMQQTTIAGLLGACYSPENKVGRGEGLATLLGMIAREIVHCDLYAPLTETTRIWLSPEMQTSSSNHGDI